MTTNRISYLLDPSGFSSQNIAVQSMEALFEGPQTFEDLLTETIKNKIEKARQEGFDEAIKKVMQTTEKLLQDYILLITKIGKTVTDISSQQFKEIGVKQFRAKIAFDSRWINLCFVINASLEDEFKFSNLLNEFERAVLNQNNQIAEIFYVNEKDRTIDYASLKTDYPYAFVIPAPSK